MPDHNRLNEKVFEEKFSQKQYKAAADLAVLNPDLQTEGTLKLFQSVEWMADGQSPLIIYLSAITETRKLTEFESIEFVNYAAGHERIDLLFDWIKNGMFTESVKVEKEVRRVSQKLAVCLQQTSSNPEKVVQAFICSSQFEKIIPYCMDVGHSLDILKTIREVISYDA